MFANSWSPEQWASLIVVAGGQLAILIKMVKGDKTTKVTAETLATKVADNTDTVKDAHATLGAKVDDVLDTVRHQQERLNASIGIRRVLSDRVDSHETQLRDHDGRLKRIERHPSLKGEM